MKPREQKPAVSIRVVPCKPAEADFAVEVSLTGFAVGETIPLWFMEVNSDDSDDRDDRELGRVSGKVLGTADSKRPFEYSFEPAELPPPVEGKPVRIAFQFVDSAHLEGFRTVRRPGARLVYALSDELYDKDEGDFWEVQVQVPSLGLYSQTVRLARIRRQLESQPCTYDWHDGHRIQLYHDASENPEGTAGAFHDLKEAIRAAKHFVFVVDWSFHPLHRMTRDSAATPANTIGALLTKKACDPKCLVAVHTWSHTEAGAADSVNDAAPDALTAIAWDLGLQGRPQNFLWRATSRTGMGWSHHQKFIVLDCDGAEEGRRDLKVFFGGLDLTKGRFDWHSHVVSPTDRAAAALREDVKTGSPPDAFCAVDASSEPRPQCDRFTANDWYNPEFSGSTELPRQPWHDIHMSAQGPCAWDFLREFVGRWTRCPSAGGDTGDCRPEHVEAVWAKYRQMRDDRKTFVQQYERPPGGTWGVQVFRSLDSEHWNPPNRAPKDAADRAAFESVTWNHARRLKLGKAENSIQRAYRQAISQAEKFIYIENQFLIGSGSHWQEKGGTAANDIPERIVNRIVERAAAEQPFHVYIVKPMSPEGDPTAMGNQETRHNEWMTAQHMISTLARRFRDWSKYLSFYFLANWSPKKVPVHTGTRAERVRGNDRYMVYVHSKFMIVDDRYFILGSCNLNERGLAGDRDSEIAAGVWPGNDKAPEEIRNFRLGIWESHFGKGVTKADTPGDFECSSEVRKRGDANYRNFRTLVEPPQGHACRWPYTLDKSGALVVKTDYPIFDGDRFLPDRPGSEAGSEWEWDTPGSYTMDLLHARVLGE